MKSKTKYYRSFVKKIKNEIKPSDQFTSKRSIDSELIELNYNTSQNYP